MPGWVCFKDLGVNEITLINTASLAIILPSCLDLVSSVFKIGKGQQYFFIRLYCIMLEIYFKNVQGARTVMLSAVTIQAMSSLCI